MKWHSRLSIKMLAASTAAFLATSVARSQCDESTPQSCCPAGNVGLGERPPIRYLSAKDGIECLKDFVVFMDSPSCGRFWADGELLLGWQSRPRIPALVTSSPAGTPFGTAAVLGNSTTTTLFGGGNLDQGTFTGGA